MNIVISLNKVEDLKNFISDIRTLPYDIDAFKGSYVIDGKSMMGLLSLGLSSPITVRINTDDEEVIKQFEKICLKYKA